MYYLKAVGTRMLKHRKELIINEELIIKMINVYSFSPILHF